MVSWRYFSMWFNHIARGEKILYVKLSDKRNYIETCRVAKKIGWISQDYSAGKIYHIYKHFFRKKELTN
jgi:hypothetical protein